MCPFCVRDRGLVAVPEGDSTHGEVVGAELNLDSVSRKDSDVVHSHLSTYVSENFHIPFVKLDAETGIREVFKDCAV